MVSLSSQKQEQSNTHLIQKQKLEFARVLTFDFGFARPPKKQGNAELMQQQLDHTLPNIVVPFHAIYLRSDIVHGGGGSSDRQEILEVRLDAQEVDVQKEQPEKLLKQVLFKEFQKIMEKHEEIRRGKENSQIDDEKIKRE